VQKLSQRLISPRHMALASPSEALWRIRLRLNGLNVLNFQSFADMYMQAEWRKNLATAR